MEAGNVRVGSHGPPTRSSMSRNLASPVLAPSRSMVAPMAQPFARGFSFWSSAGSQTFERSSRIGWYPQAMASGYQPMTLNKPLGIRWQSTAS